MASRSQKYIEGLILRGFSPAQSAAIAGNFQAESAGDPNAFNAGEGAYGLMQWRLDRKTGLENYAKSTGRDPSDPEAQMDWLAIEMTGPEAGNAKAFLSAQDPASASAALKPYIRYAAGTENDRLRNTMALAQSYGSGQQGNTGMQANAQTGMSDDDLLKAFLGGSSSAPSAPASNDNGQTDDDDLLKSFLQPTKAEADDAAAVPRNDLNRFLFGGDRAPANLMELVIGTGEKNKELGGYAGDVAKRIEANSETGYTPSSVPWLDPVSTFANSAVEAVPIAGPFLNQLTNNLDAATASMIEGKPVTAAERAAINKAQAQQFSDLATAGTIAGTVGPFLGLGSTGVGARLLGVSGTVPQQIGMGMLSNALISGGDTLARGGSLEDAGKNALVGGALGGAAPAVLGGNMLTRTLGGAGLGGGITAAMGGDQEEIARNALLGAGAGAGISAVGKAGNALLGKTSPETAKLAQKAIDQYGIPISLGQMSDNPMVRFADDVISKMPFTGGGVSAAEQQAAFNKAVAKTIGEDATKISPDVMSAARSRLGDVFDSVATRTPVIAAGPNFDQRMLDIISSAQMVLPDSEIKPLMSQWNDIVDKFGKGGNAISGETYQALTRKGAPLDLASRSSDPNIRHYATQMRNALDDALEASAAPEVIADLKQARSQWKAMKTIEDLVEKSPTGDISPALLQNAARSSYSDIAYGGGGALADLGKVGQKLLKAPNSSGTAERMAIMNALTKVGGVGGLGAAAVMNPGSLPMMAAIGVPTAAATYGAARAANALMRSKGLAKKMIANSLGQTIPAQVGPTINRLLARTGSGAAALEEPKKKVLDITVRGGGR